MRERIIIETDNKDAILAWLKKEQMTYKIISEVTDDWLTQEQMALAEWEKLSDEELISQWEQLS